MPSYLVTMKYNEHLHRQYFVQNVEGHRAAMAYVLEHNTLYDPGVPVEVTEVPINNNKTRHFENLGAFND
jgi:hypothetical protein